MKYAFIKRGGAGGLPSVLTPATDEAEAWARKIKPGDVIEVDVVRPRSQRFHRLFFALLKIVSDNMDGGSIEGLLREIKIGLKHTEIALISKHAIMIALEELLPLLSNAPPLAFFDAILPDPVPCNIPKSISFSAMDQDTFAAFFTKSVDYVIQNVLPGIDREALTYEVYNMANVPLSLADAIYKERSI